MNDVKGSIDYFDNNLQKINYLKNIIYDFANRLNLKEFDTPIIEKTSLLLGKYSDEVETKLLFSLDEKDESLRYDQTVPLQRLVLENKFENLRRLQYGKVFRRDKPQPEKGRFREFYQLDIDLINQNYPELDIFWLIFSVLDKLNLSYQVKYNYRDNLYAMLLQAGFTNKKDYSYICSQIDKLDKLEFNEIKNILLSKYNKTIIDNLETLLQNNYLDKSLIEKNNNFITNLSKIISENSIKNLLFTPSLARGLDYYTGIIFEVVILNNNISSSVIAGGEYNKFLYLLNSKGEKKYLPAIGVSFGISRMEKLDLNFEKINKKLLLIITKENKEKEIEILYNLRNKLNNFIIDYNFTSSNILKNITFAVKNNYQYCVIFGENDNKYKLKELFNKNEDIIFENIIKLIDYLNE